MGETTGFELFSTYFAFIGWLCPQRIDAANTKQCQYQDSGDGFHDDFSLSTVATAVMRRPRLHH
jgi:hypothetical protein